MEQQAEQIEALDGDGMDRHCLSVLSNSSAMIIAFVFVIKALTCPNIINHMDGHLGNACWADEDYIGRISRLSRKVGSSRLTPLRTITRSLMNYRRQLKKFASCRHL